MLTYFIMESTRYQIYFSDNQKYLHRKRYKNGTITGCRTIDFQPSFAPKPCLVSFPGNKEIGINQRETLVDKGFLLIYAYSISIIGHARYNH